MNLKEIISIAPRYTRAVSLERDASTPSAIEGYLLTTSGTDVLERLIMSLCAPRGHRAWTITGPYGSGKSAFALFLAHLLNRPDLEGTRIARTIFREDAGGLFRALFDQRRANSLAMGGFCPVLVTGASEPIVPALMRSICRDVRSYIRRGRAPDALQQLDRLSRAAAQDKPVSGTAVASSVSELARQLGRMGQCQGLLIIIDELGKLLEFAARNPERGDVYILQQLAEATAAVDSPNLYLITILHQAFERYAANLRPAARAEWAKVQGRFTDVAFQEPPEQILTLLSRAIVHKGGQATADLRQSALVLASEACRLQVGPKGLPPKELLRLLVGCSPLHPLAAIALTKLVRQFGQHQRSLFAFLMSREAAGFASYLEQTSTRAPIAPYGLPSLYDYSISASGNALATGEGGARWLETQNILERCGGATDAELATIKTVGLISAMGPTVTLKASRDVIRFALGEKTLNGVCDQLVSKSVLVYRKHSSSYALWQGSDVNFEEQIAEAERRVPRAPSLASRMTARFVPRPVVAKRHSFTTGTLRYFQVKFVDAACLSSSLDRDRNADGLLLYFLPATSAEIEDAVDFATKSPLRERVDVVTAIPRHLESLEGAFRELELLRWVEQNTPELQGDGVARRELRSRMAVAERVLQLETDNLFSPSANSRTIWFHRGIQQVIPSTRTLSQLLSDICDTVYFRAPRLKNELLNRTQLSSAAAKARRNLIEALICHAEEASLGIDGTPPEKSMYLSVLHSTGIHRKEGDVFTLNAPPSSSTVAPVWAGIEAFFSDAELQRRRVSELFDILQRAPYGLKLGVIPVIFCAAAVVHDTDVALYEDGAFVPEMTIEVFERLLRAPEKFEVRSYRVEGVRKVVFKEYANLLGTGSSTSYNVVAVVKPLYRFLSRLPDYAKKTAALTGYATAVREALISARDPDVLLFRDLPVACGMQPFLPSAGRNSTVREFFSRLQTAFFELRRAYDDLIIRLTQLLGAALGEKGSDFRSALKDRAIAIADYAIEPRMKALILHLTDDSSDDRVWIEAIGSLCTGKPPKAWTDADCARYEVAIGDLGRALRHLEAVVFELARSKHSSEAPSAVFRIGITDQHSGEREAVVSVRQREEATLARAIIGIEGAIENAGVHESPRLALAALASVSRHLLEETDNALEPIREVPVVKP